MKYMEFWELWDRTASEGVYLDESATWHYIIAHRIKTHGYLPLLEEVTNKLQYTLRTKNNETTLDNDFLKKKLQVFC